jgi:hypothetical protein
MFISLRHSKSVFFLLCVLMLKGKINLIFLFVPLQHPHFLFFKFIHLYNFFFASFFKKASKIFFFFLLKYFMMFMEIYVCNFVLCDIVECFFRKGFVLNKRNVLKGANKMKDSVLKNIRKAYSPTKRHYNRLHVAGLVLCTSIISISTKNNKRIICLCNMKYIIMGNGNKK